MEKQSTVATPKVSVLIPIYKVEQFIERCAVSLFEQTLEEIEYIFVDDCSPDYSISVLNSVIDRYPHRQSQIKILRHKENQGVGMARTTAILAATGEYLIHCDPDDYVDTCMYEEMYNKAVSENADIVCCNAVVEMANRKKELIYENDSIKNFNIEEIYSALWNKLIKRELYTDYKILPFKGINMWEDMGITFRLRILSRRTVILPKAFYHYVVRNENSICSDYSKKQLDEQILCTGKLEEFIARQGLTKEYGMVIQNLKFRAKNALFINKKMKNYRLWRNTFPECNTYIWKFKYISVHMRIIYLLVAYRCTFVASILMGVKRCLKWILR